MVNLEKIKRGKEGKRIEGKGKERNTNMKERQ